jgi:hypothetical protein
VRFRCSYRKPRFAGTSAIEEPGQRPLRFRFVRTEPHKRVLPQPRETRNSASTICFSHKCWRGIKMKSTCTSMVLGVLGAALLSIFWVSSFYSRQADALLRPYGLFIWFAVLIAAILLLTIAAIRSSKWWFLAVAASLATAGHFFLAVMA